MVVPQQLTSAILCGIVLCSSPVRAGDKPGGDSQPAAPLRKATTEIDRALPDYKPADRVSEPIKMLGSEVNLATLWLEKFHTIYPRVQAEIEGQG